MKHLLTFLLLMCSYVLCGAQATSLTVDNQTPGWLSSKINYGDQQTVENLTVTGYINATDLTFIGSLMQKHNLHQSLDLTDVYIVGSSTNDDNDISFSNIFGLNATVDINLLSLPKSIKVPKSKSSYNLYPLEYLSIDTLIYGSESCNVLTKHLSINPKVLILREGVTKIEAVGTHSSKKKLESVIMPQTVDSIGDKAFLSCKNLSAVNLPNGIHTIGNYAFAETSFKPDTLRLPSQLKIYHTRSFPCNPGQVIVIPEGVEEFDNASGGGGTLDIYNRGICSYDTYYLIINRIQPPRFRANYGPRYVDLESCHLYVPKEGLKLYKDLKYNSNIYGEGGNPYSYANVSPIPVPIESVILNFQSYVLNVGNTIDLFVNIKPTNADNPNVTWQSSDTNIAQVNQSGKVTALSSGQCTIKVMSNENPSIFALCEITVRQPLQSISLNYKSITLNAGQTYDGLSLTYYPAIADNKNVTWQSSNGEILAVDDAGRITAIKGGDAKVIVTSVENSSIRDECIVTVLQPTTGITLDKSEVEVIEDESIQLNATVLPENASNKKVSWSSSDVSIAMVSPDGTVYAIKPGQATIMATTEDGGFVALCKITVKAKEVIASAIRLSNTTETIAVGETLKLNAVLEPENVTSKNISWTSTNTDVATVNADGLVKAVSEGSTQIIATTTDGSNLSAICYITVERQFVGITQIKISPSDARIVVGQSLTLDAIITPSDASSPNVLWSSTNTSVATVSQNGKIDAVAEGEAIIIASTQDGSNLSATCNISVYNEAGIESILENKNANVKIFDLNGLLVYEGLYGDARIAPGFYIIIYHGRRYKAMIN